MFKWCRTREASSSDSVVVVELHDIRKMSNTSSLFDFEQYVLWTFYGKTKTTPG